MSHHWIDNPDFGNDEAPEESRKWPVVCKHCETFGDECWECHGTGTEYESSLHDDEVEECPTCGGEGYIQ